MTMPPSMAMVELAEHVYLTLQAQGPTGCTVVALNLNCQRARKFADRFADNSPHPPIYHVRRGGSLSPCIVFAMATDQAFATFFPQFPGFDGAIPEYPAGEFATFIEVEGDQISLRGHRLPVVSEATEKLLAEMGS